MLDNLNVNASYAVKNIKRKKIILCRIVYKIIFYYEWRVRMSYCINCGDKIENEEMICVSCGTNMKKYLKGKGILNETEHHTYIGDILDKAIIILRGMLFTPVTSILNYSKEMSIKLSITLVITFAMFFGVLGAWVFEVMFSNLIKFNEQLFKVTVGSARGQNNDEILTRSIENIKKVQMSFGKAFLIFSILFIICIAAVVIFSYIISRYVFKCKGNIVRMFNSCVCAVIPLLVGTVFQIIFSYINLAFSLVPMIIGLSISVICLYHGIKDSMQLDENKSALLLPFTYILLIIVTYSYIERIVTSYFTLNTIKRIILYMLGTGMYY
jgi:hypothetical protein